jgi:hypothetical protein
LVEVQFRFEETYCLRVNSACRLLLADFLLRVPFDPEDQDYLLFQNMGLFPYTRLNNPEDHILYSHRCENLKSNLK